jgi:hypothetical protein
MGAPQFGGDVVVQFWQTPQRDIPVVTPLFTDHACGRNLMVNNIRVLTHQSSFQAINQRFLAKGLAQEPDCPGRQRLRTRRIISKT